MKTDRKKQTKQQQQAEQQANFVFLCLKRRSTWQTRSKHQLNAQNKPYSPRKTQSYGVQFKRVDDITCHIHRILNIQLHFPN